MTPLHQFGNLIRESMLSIPLGVVRGLFLVTLAAVLLWVLRLPRSETRPTATDPHWTSDLKFPAAAALLFQILIYAFL